MTGPSEDKAAAGRGQLRAAHADRDLAIDVLKAAFVQGRLDKDEFDARVGQVFASRTYAELTEVTCDLPAVLVGAQPARAQARSSETRGIRSSVRVIRVGTTLAAGVWAVALVAGSALALTLALTFTLAYVGSLLLAGAVLLESRRELPSAGLPPPGSGPGGSRRTSTAPCRALLPRTAGSPRGNGLVPGRPVGHNREHELRSSAADARRRGGLGCAADRDRGCGRQRGVPIRAGPAGGVRRPGPGFPARLDGYNQASLGVDANSLTGAVRLYERVGFTVDNTRTAYQKQLR